MSNNGEFEYINVVPSNQPADGVVKFNSMPILNFNIGAQERLLLGDSIKLTGEFIVKYIIKEIKSNNRRNKRL